MPGDDVPEPRTLPAWLEAGVSGVPRERSWDAVVTAEMPELRGSKLTRVSFQVIAPGQVEIVGTEGASDVTREALSALVAHATGSLAPPLEARAIRTSNGQWSIAARTTKRRPAGIELPKGIDLMSVACAPDGELTVHIDGELVIDLAGDAAATASEVIEEAESEHSAFVATLERFSSGRVGLSIDPL